MENKFGKKNKITYLENLCTASLHSSYIERKEIEENCVSLALHNFDCKYKTQDT